MVSEIMRSHHQPSHLINHHLSPISINSSPYNFKSSNDMVEWAAKRSDEMMMVDCERWWHGRLWDRYYDDKLHGRPVMIDWRMVRWWKRYVCLSSTILSYHPSNMRWWDRLLLLINHRRYHLISSSTINHHHLGYESRWDFMRLLIRWKTFRHISYHMIIRW